MPSNCGRYAVDLIAMYLWRRTMASTDVFRNCTITLMSALFLFDSISESNDGFKRFDN
jgi:hypothetical protein